MQLVKYFLADCQNRFDITYMNLHFILNIFILPINDTWELESKRPIGITIIAILLIISGILFLVGGIGFVLIAPLLNQLEISDTTNSEGNITINVNGTDIVLPNSPVFVLLGRYIGLIGGILIGISIASFLVAWGLFKGKGWAWVFTMTITTISIALNGLIIVVGDISGIIGMIIDAVIIYYLYRPNVRSYFGRGKGPTI
jgi:hypothetical protein